MSGRPRPTDAEFDELKRKRDEAVAGMIDAVCKQQGWDPEKVGVHHSHSSICYCACPDGPCQHIWDGPEWQNNDDTGFASSATCSRCGEIAMFHDMRTAEF